VDGIRHLEAPVTGSQTRKRICCCRRQTRTSCAIADVAAFFRGCRCRTRRWVRARPEFPRTNPGPADGVCCPATENSFTRLARSDVEYPAMQCAVADSVPDAKRPFVSGLEAVNLLRMYDSSCGMIRPREGELILLCRRTPWPLPRPTSQSRCPTPGRPRGPRLCIYNPKG
jgi:hypothetical protein